MLSFSTVVGVLTVVSGRELTTGVALPCDNCRVGGVLVWGLRLDLRLGLEFFIIPETFGI